MRPLRVAVFAATCHSATCLVTPEALNLSTPAAYAVTSAQNQSSWPFGWPAVSDAVKSIVLPAAQATVQKSLKHGREQADRKMEVGQATDAASATRGERDARGDLEIDLAAAAGTHADALIGLGTAQRIAELAEAEVPKAARHTKKAEKKMATAMDFVDWGDAASAAAGKEEEDAREAEALLAKGGAIDRTKLFITAAAARGEASKHYKDAEGKMETALSAAFESADSQRRATGALKDSLGGIVGEAKAAERAAVAAEQDEARRVAEATLSTAATGVAPAGGPAAPISMVAEARHGVVQLHQTRDVPDIQAATDQAMSEKMAAFRTLASQASAAWQELQRLRAASEALERKRTEAQQEFSSLLGRDTESSI